MTIDTPFDIGTTAYYPETFNGVLKDITICKVTGYSITEYGRIVAVHTPYGSTSVSPKHLYTSISDLLKKFKMVELKNEPERIADKPKMKEYLD